jgi:hypothetical protein
VTGAVLALLMAIGACAPAGGLAQSETMPLLDAMRSGLVAATFSGLGGSTGDTIMVRVRRNATAGARRLRLTIPPGSLLRSSDASTQNMVILSVRGRDLGGGEYAPEGEIAVGDEAVSYLLAAACADFDKQNPSRSSTFSLEPPADTVLACIAQRAAADRPVVAQAAVWAYRDAVSYERVNEVFEMSEADWSAGQGLLRACGR